MPSTITDRPVKTDLQFKFLPGFAKHILQNHVDRFAMDYIQLARELKLPLLQYFNHLSEKELIDLSRQRVIDYLDFIARNDARTHITQWLQTWKLDQLPEIEKSAVVTEDITLLGFIRKQVFLRCLPYYTTDAGEMINIISEIDTLMVETENAALNAFMDYSAQRLRKHEYELLEAQELAGMGSFEWDLASNKVAVTPQLKIILELDGPAKMDEFVKQIHPSDRNKVNEAIKKAIEKNEIYEAEYRFIGKEKEKVIWSRGIISHQNGKRIMRGTVMDVTDRHHMIQKLVRSEELYKQAQALTHIGNYTWDLRTEKFIWSDELYRIYGLSPGQALDYETISGYTHKDDTAHVKELALRSIQEGIPFDYQYRIVLNNGDEKILHARGDVLIDNNDGKVYKVFGTVADVTERQQLFNELQKNRDLYKQAALLAKMGNWTWDVVNNKLEWTEELYHIYELDPSTPVDYTLFERLTHPDDLEFANKSVQEAFTTLKLDYHLRIITPTGKEKIIHSIGNVQTNEKGEPIMFVGTAQDVTEKQNLLKQLQVRDELYKQAQALAHIGNWSWDVRTNAVSWTDEVYRIYGIAPQSETITFERYLGLLHPADREMVLGYINRCIEKHEPYQFYHRIIADDGREKVLDSKGEVVLDKEGKPKELRGTVQDVTEQKQIEQEVRDKQHFIQKIADAAPSIIASYNINTGKYLFVSQGLEKLLGYDTSLILEQGISFFAELIHPDDVARVMQENANALEFANNQQPGDPNEMIVEFEYRMRHMNGDYKWFHTYGTVFDRNNDNKVEHVLNISIDITESIESREKIREQEHFITHIADASPTVLYLFDAVEGKVLYINKEAESVVGYTPEEIIAMGTKVIPNLYHPDDIARIGERLHNYKESKDPKALFQFELRMRHRNGDWRWLLIREIVFKHSPEGKILELLGSCLDITNRKEMESALFRKTLELQQSNASLGEFAYVASHDLKEPLRKITTFGDMLAGQYKSHLTGDGILYLNKIVESSRRMQLLIDDLLSLSLISNEKTFEDHDLNAILNEVIQSMDHKIEEKNAVVTISKLPVVNVVPTQIRQLFQNLLSNSLKYVKHGKKPEISIMHKIMKPYELVLYSSLARAAQYIRIDFRDNGIGFDQVFAEKIFTIFQRLHGRAEYEGTGIGLAICKKIVENHGGVIFANGKQEEGAEFTVILPMV